MNMKKLFVAAFAALAALLFVACDSPVKAVRNFHEGVIEKDTELLASAKYFNAQERRHIKEDGERDYLKRVYEDIHDDDDEIDEFKTYEIIGSKEDGNLTYVFVAYNKDGKENGDLNVRTFQCEKIAGKWKITELR